MTMVMLMMIIMKMKTKSLCRNLEQSSTQQGKALTIGNIGCYTFKNPLTREILVSRERICT